MPASQPARRYPLATRAAIGARGSFEEGDLLEVDDIHLDLVLAAPGSKAIRLREVVIDGATLNVQQRGTTSRNEVLRYMESSEPASPQDADTEPRIIIDRFTFARRSRHARSREREEPEQLDLPEVVVNDVGRSTGGSTFGETAEALLEPILAAERTAVRTESQNAAADAATREIEEAAERKLDELLDRD